MSAEDCCQCAVDAGLDCWVVINVVCDAVVECGYVINGSGAIEAFYFAAAVSGFVAEHFDVTAVSGFKIAFGAIGVTVAGEAVSVF